VRHKKHELLQLLQTRRVPVAIISETYLKVRDKFTLRNYKVHRNDREHRRGGGTAIAVHKSIQHTVVDNPARHRLESTAICPNIGNKPTTLVSIYNPPDDIDIGDLAELLRSSDLVLIAGDFNTKHITWNCRQTNTAGRKLFDYYNESNIEFQIIAPYEPTLIPDVIRQQPDIVDMAVAKNIQQVTVEVLNELSFGHLPIRLTVRGQPTKAVDRITLNYENANWPQFNEDVEKELDIEDLTTQEALDHGVTKITKVIQTAINTNIPTRKNKISRQAYPLHTIELINQKNEARRRWQRHHDNIGYKRETNRLKFQIRLAIQTYVTESWNNMLATHDTRDMGEAWKLTKKITYSQSPSTPLHTTQGPVYTSADKAVAFANNLVNTFTPNIGQNAAFTQETEETVRNFLNNPPTTTIRQTNKHELRWQIKHLKDRKAPGPDGIQNIVLKQLPIIAIEYLSKLINGIFHTKYFPATWKEARILLFPKPRKNPRDPANYRPY
jgi:Endonuclease/Exonuclease/phosphatase family.